MSTDQGMSSADACGSRALFGWSPAALPADTPLKRAVDRILVGVAPGAIIVMLVIALQNVAPHLPVRGELALDGLAALAGGGWCSLNFWRCRHAHCLVTGAGWLSLSLLTFVEAGMARSVMHGDEQPVFLGVLVGALVFEGTWFLTHHTNALNPAQRGGLGPC
ncbi:MAG: hypothetical protein ACRDOD_08305 [Streptosporangiaceae bacterium]